MAFKSYIKIPRELFCSEEWTAGRHFSRFEAQVDLLRSAAYTDGFIVHCPTRDVVLRRGQLLTSQRDLADRWGWSPATVNRYLQVLRNTRRNSIRIKIETAIETGRTLITICDYDEWDFVSESCETFVETGSGTHHETPHETHIELNSSIIENKDITHTQVFTEKGVVGGKAAELLLWVVSNYPAVQQMSEPLTEQQAIWMLRRYELTDIRRLLAQMDNKGATRNKSAYSTFVSFAGRDLTLRERGAGKLYTYEEMTNEIPSRAKNEDFEMVEVQGRKMWRKKLSR